MRRTKACLIAIALALVAGPECAHAGADKDKGPDFGDRALKATYGAGSAAANASLGALLATMKTMGLVTTAVGSSVKTIADLGQPLWGGLARGTGKMRHPASKTPPKPLPAGYSPSETKIVCKNCGQETLIRGDLPGLVIRCPGCEKIIKE